MNLIFAVIFGMVAYRMGVSYTPCLVGSTSPGLSAWEVGLQTGDRIVQLGATASRRTPAIRQRHDGQGHDDRGQSGSGSAGRAVRGTATSRHLAQQWTTVRLSSPQDELRGRPIIGISPYRHHTVAVTDELLDSWPPGRDAGRAAAGTGDEIIAVNGEPVAGLCTTGWHLAAKVDRPVQLTVQRFARRIHADDGDRRAERDRASRATITLAGAGNADRPDRLGPTGFRRPNGRVCRSVTGSRTEPRSGSKPDDLATSPAPPGGSGDRTSRDATGVDQPVSITVTLRQVNVLQLGLGLGDAIGGRGPGLLLQIGNQIVFVASGTRPPRPGSSRGTWLSRSCLCRHPLRMPNGKRRSLAENASSTSARMRQMAARRTTDRS